MALYESLWALHFGIHEGPLVLAHDPYACQDSALNLIHLLSGQDLAIVNNRDLLEPVLMVVYIETAFAGSGEAWGSCRMGDLTSLAGMVGGGRGVLLVGGFGGQDLIPAVTLSELWPPRAFDLIHSSMGNLTTLTLTWSIIDLTWRQPKVQLGTGSLAAPGRWSGREPWLTDEHLSAAK